MENEIQKQEKTNDVFLTTASFDHIQRVAKALSSSNLVPKEYKDNVSNTIIALDIANRIGASPLMVMQHLNIIQGKPSWSSTFLIAAINNSGRFTSLKFDISGSGDSLACSAYATDKSTGEKLESPKITMEMAKKEGWLSKNGSKWLSMPDLMIRYRAAAFFSRLYCPEITMGMQTVEEIQDAVIIDDKKPDVAKEVETRVLMHIEKSKTLDQLAQVEKECITPTLTDLYEKRKAEIQGKLAV